MKRLALFTAMLFAFPVWLSYKLASVIAGNALAFASASQWVSLLPGVFGGYIRWSFYRLTLPNCGRDAFIGMGALFSHSTARVGARAYIGPYCVIGDVDLGEDVLLGSNVSIINGSRQHGIDRLDVPIREQPGVFPRISIGRDVWIGDRALVMADVGAHAVVGGGAVVTKPVPDFAIVVGSPARVVRFRNQACETSSDRCSEVAVAPMDRVLDV